VHRKYQTEAYRCFLGKLPIATCDTCPTQLRLIDKQIKRPNVEWRANSLRFRRR